jgi:SAM-dependent methyltransferase
MPDNISTTSQTVAKFYDKHGWIKQDGGVQGEDTLFRTFPTAHARYAAQTMDRIHGLLGPNFDNLLFAGCGDMPENHVRIAHTFKHVTCIDISETALDIARDKLGADNSYVRQSIPQTTLPSDTFDTVYCAHVIFHINKTEQEAAVRQLVRVTKPGGRVVIIYANPMSPFAMPGESARRVKKWIGDGRRKSDKTLELYYHAHPLSWWQRFSDRCKVSFAPSEVIGSRPARALLRTERMASAFYLQAAWLEARAPKQLAVKFWQYQIVVLDKK